MATPTIKESLQEEKKHIDICNNFLTKISDLIPPFLNRIEEKLLREHNLDVSQYPADHVCWRTESEQEYSELMDALRTDAKDNNNKECTLLIESRIGGRMIAVIHLKHAIPVNENRTIDVIEIPAPKVGSPYPSGLEHVEFVIGGSAITEYKKLASPVNDERHQSAFDRFMEEHDGIQWKTKAKSKDINPDISLTLDLEPFGQCSVKFHLMPLAEVIQYEKHLAKNQGML